LAALIDGPEAALLSAPVLLPARVRAAVTMANAAVVMLRLGAILVLLSPLLVAAMLFA
jgi:hypothetical protein